MNHGTDGDIAQRQVVARLNIGACTALYKVTLAELVGSNDVALLAICVMQKCDTRSAVRVVLNVSDLCWHAIFVITTEVDETVGALMSATLVTNGDATGRVTTTLGVDRTDERLLRGGASDLNEVRNARATTARSCRLVFTNTHESILFFRSWLR